MKYLSILLASLLVFAASVSPAFSQKGLGWPFLLVEQADSTLTYYMGDQPIMEYFDNYYSPDAENEGYPILTLYVHEDCNHCRVVEEYLEETDQTDLVERKELKDNEENMVELEAVWTDLNPDAETGTESEESSPNYVLLGVGVLVILAIVVYGVASVFFKDE